MQYYTSVSISVFIRNRADFVFIFDLLKAVCLADFLQNMAKHARHYSVHVTSLGSTLVSFFSAYLFVYLCVCVHVNHFLIVCFVQG